MNLLVVTSNRARASFRQRVAIYLDTLRANGIDSEVVEIPAGGFSRLKLYRRAREFDGVFWHKKRINLGDVYWLRRYPRKIIYDFDDAVMYNGKNPGRQSRKRRASFRRTVKLADLVIAGNTYLADRARKFNPNVEVLPTALDVTAYKLAGDAKKDGKIRLVWIGSGSTLKYLAEIKPALEEVGLRFDNVILRIVCDDFFELENMEVEKCCWSLESQAKDLALSDIGITPLADNRFTRGKCGFKILQYAAAGLPIVASPADVRAEYFCDGVSGFQATDTSEWVDKISKLVENQELRGRMGQAGRIKARDFDAGVLGGRFVGLLKKCLGSCES